MSYIDGLSSDQLAQLDQLKEYIEEYCESQGIDASTFVDSIDGDLSADFLNDPVFQAYWQMAYLQLLYLLSGGSPSVASNGEIEYPDDLMSVYNSASQEMLDYCTSLLTDNPELMVFFAMQTGDFQEGDTANSLLALISQTEASTATETETEDDSDDEWENTIAREFVAKYGSSESLDWLIEYEEGIRAAEGSILDYLAEMDQQMVELTEALEGGSMSAEEYQAEMESISSYREVMLTMLQSLESTMSNVMEMYSKMIENMQEMQMAVINNWRSA